MEPLSPIQEERVKQAYVCVNGAGESGATVQDVAKSLKMRPTPYLRDLLEQLVSYGWCRKEQGIIQTGRGARMGWKYFVIPEATQ